MQTELDKDVLEEVQMEEEKADDPDVAEVAYETADAQASEAEISQAHGDAPAPRTSAAGPMAAPAPPRGAPHS